jgi:UrcA family protein
MLKQHLKSFGLKSAGVKTAAALTLMLGATPMLAHSADVTKTRYAVKFEKKLASTDAGVEKIYAMFESKAKRACSSPGSVDADGNRLSKSECVADLVAQMVESAKLEPVKAYHVAKLAEAK